MNQFVKYLFFFTWLFLFINGCRIEERDISIIPKPVSQKLLSGEFTLEQKTKIIIANNDFMRYAIYLRNYIENKYGIQTQIGINTPKKNFIRLSLTDSIDNEEGYLLKIRENTVEITASSDAGIFYGIQTFLQMLLPEAKKYKQITVPAIDIKDFPQFRWRGQHLDVGRHFFSVDFIKNLLDVMAMHKLNIFHWHLTEDQGWRIEIQKYPKLIEIGSWRDSTLFEAADQYPPKYKREKYGGHYTQEEIRDIVQYAQERHITVVPEIEMPGHCLAALAAYPQFSCTGGPFSVGTRWGVFDDVFCAGKEKTFEFLENILDEVIQLFPGQYIHIGGDEVPKTRWKNCADCQRKIREEGLKDENELQSYFIKRIENYLHSKGKKVIGWEEIIEGGLPERSVVMSWRGVDGGIKAAKAHHYTIMTPWNPCYFYVYQGKYEEPIAGGGDDSNLLSDVYNFDPVPDTLNETETEFIMGGQGCAWTEYMPNTDIAEYMIFPRLSALAEALWSDKTQKNWDDFLKRMDDQYLRLDYYNINYRIDYPDNYGFINRYPEDKVQVKLNNVIHNSKIRYTTDGNEPDESSPLYKKPITINLESRNPVILKSRTFMPNGRISAVHTGEFVKLDWKDACDPGSVTPGLRYLCFEREIRSVEEINAYPDKTGIVDNVKFPGEKKGCCLAIVYEGFINVPDKAVYDFYLSSSRGKTLLYIDEMNVVDNTAELSRYYQKTGKIALEKGYHRFNLKYLTANHQGQIKLGCNYNGNKIEEIPVAWFYH